MCIVDVYVEEPVKLYDSTNPDWVPHLRMGYKIEVPDKERYERLKQRKKRKLQCASVDHEVDVAIADGGKADAICQTDDGWINNVKGNTIQNLQKELKNTQNELTATQKELAQLKQIKLQFEKDVEKKLTELMNEKQQLECKVKELTKQIKDTSLTDRVMKKIGVLHW